MPDHIPPTEAELKEKLDWISKPGGSLHADEVRWIIAEIRRLRVLCGRAKGHPWRLSSIADAKMRSKLGRASKGEV